MKKLAVVAWNELRLRIGDPILWLLAIAARPLVAARISLAFGDLVLGQTMPEARIAVGIVNADRSALHVPGALSGTWHVDRDLRIRRHVSGCCRDPRSR